MVISRRNASSFELPNLYLKRKETNAKKKKDKAQI